MRSQQPSTPFCLELRRNDPTGRMPECATGFPSDPRRNSSSLKPDRVTMNPPGQIRINLTVY